MKIKILLFASLRDIYGHGELELQAPIGSTPEVLFQDLVRQTPDLARFQPVVRYAVNREYCESTRLLAEGDEIAFISPVSGG